MKNKPLRHKTTNTFKFQSFADRIANIDIDVFHYVKHKYEEEDEQDQETYFHQTLEKWTVLNLTQGFEALRKELPPAPTLPQLILFKDDITQILIKYLKKNEAPVLQPILELVIAQAKDLRNEFYPFYSEYLPVLIELLSSKDTEQLEWTLSCLAYLFKFLWRYLIKDLRVVFKNLLPLLSDGKPYYINNFAAESFAFVARKVKDKKYFLKLIFKILNENPDSIVGCGHLLFEIVKGVAGQFHSCADSLLPLFWESVAEESFNFEIVQEVIEQIVKAFLKNIKPNACQVFWSNSNCNLE